MEFAKKMKHKCKKTLRTITLDFILTLLQKETSFSSVVLNLFFENPSLQHAIFAFKISRQN